MSSLLSQFAIETSATRRRRRINSFNAQFRKQIAELTASSVALEDLADSFPALLFALSTGFGSSSDRQAAITAIDGGATLKESAVALALPYWMRRLTADALIRPLPVLPLDQEFASAMLGRMPDRPSECGAWLDRLTLAFEIAGRDLAVWIAREPRMLPPLTTEEDLQWAVAWAWASLTPTCPGYRLIRTAWHPRNGLEACP